jgi:abhydrolase domain-containing protein 6
MPIRPLRVLAAALLPLLLGACAGLSARVVTSTKRSYRGDARLEEKRVVLGDHEVVYLDRGAGEPMLLLHGFGADKDNWTLYAKEIPDQYRVIAPDLPGFGESTRRPEALYDITSQAARLLAFVDALHLESFHIAGNSMGGQLAARFAEDHPERVKSLTLLDPAGVVSPVKSELTKQLETGRNPLLVDSVDDFDRMLRFTMVTPPSLPGPIGTYFAERALANRAFNEKIFRDLFAVPDLVAGRLGSIRARTLVVWGDSDHVLDPSAMPLWVAGIPGAQGVLMTNVGHVPMIEKPKETAAIVLGFLGGK